MELHLLECVTAEKLEPRGRDVHRLACHNGQGPGNACPVVVVVGQRGFDTFVPVEFAQHVEPYACFCVRRGTPSHAKISADPSYARIDIPAQFAGYSAVKMGTGIAIADQVYQQTGVYKAIDNRTGTSMASSGAGCALMVAMIATSAAVVLAGLATLLS